MTVAAEVRHYTVTCSGECPVCHVTVTVTGYDADNLPARNLGDRTELELKCLCGAAVPAVWVGFALAGYTTVADEKDDEEEFTNAPPPNRAASYRP